MADYKPYDEKQLKRFKRDYFVAGKYDLDIQIPHLAKLAKYYQGKYKRCKNWTDCLKAHALYNSCAVRDSENPESWKELAFDVQQSYWQECSSVTYQEQWKLVSDLKRELEAIRNESRGMIKSIDNLAQQFKLEKDKPRGLIQKFIKYGRHTSISCTDKMTNFARRIMSGSVDILADKPPCAFNVLAIGSLARGEATPYSDLEYLFLVNDKSEASMAYFEQLAMTTYFIIGSLGETKLSYMAVDELDGWFDDRSDNGFKIDGLTAGAGNIPTGNGAPHLKNHFILTTEELLGRYEYELSNPDRERALRGDFTAMLSYLKLVYDHGQSQQLLMDVVKSKLGGLVRGLERLELDQEMLKADLQKFNISPDSKLHDCGFTVNVKKNLYRFPSIILLDLSVVWAVKGQTAWETADMLCTEQKVSEQFRDDLLFLLASACYIRLSTYLFHNSHDDRLSVAVKTSSNLYDTSSHVSRAARRWFIPMGLFSAVCEHMLPIKSTLKRFDVHQPEPLSSPPLDKIQYLFVRSHTLYSCGRYTEALRDLEIVYGNQLYDSPNTVVDKILLEDTSSMETLTLVADVLVNCSHYSQGLEFSLKVHEVNNILESVKRLATCYIGLSKFSEALQVLTTTDQESGEIDMSLGNLQLQMENYQAAEKSLVLALQKFCIQAAIEQKFDYYGDPLTLAPIDTSIHSNTKELFPIERLHIIPNATTDIADAIASLQRFYHITGRYEEAEQYNSRYTELLSELYGKEALVLSAVKALCNTGNTAFTESNQGAKAEGLYLKSLKLCKEIYGEECSHVNIATLLSSLGICYCGIEQFDTAREYHEKSLQMLKTLYGDNSSQVSIAQQLREIGWCFNRTKHYKKAEVSLLKSLEMLELVYGQDNTHLNAADVLIKLGVNCNNMKKHSLAEVYYNKAMAIYKSKEGFYNQNRCIASVLLNLGYGKISMRLFTEAKQYYQEALAIYRNIYGFDDHLDIASTLTRIGHVHSKTRTFTKADECYTESLAMYRRIHRLKNNPTLMANTLRNHGIRYKEIGEYKKAATFFDESLDIYKTVYGPNEADEKIAQVLMNMGENYEKMERHNDAEESYQKSLKIYNLILKDNNTNPGIANTLHTLGVNCTAKQEYEQSLYYLTQSLAEYHRLYGAEANHEDIAILLNSLGHNCIHMKDNAQAKEYLEKSLSMHKQVHGESQTHVEIGNVFYNMGDNYIDLGDFQSAEEHLFSALQTYKAEYGIDSSHNDISMTLGVIGANYTEWGKYDKAKPYYFESITMDRELNGSNWNNKMLAMKLINLGHIHQRLFEHEEAQRYFEEGLQMYTQLQGEIHATVAGTLGLLGQTYYEKKQYPKAENYFVDSLTMYRKLSETDNSLLSDVALLLYRLGLSLSDQGKHSKADECLKESLQLYRQLHGEDAKNISIASLLFRLGHNHYHMGHYDKASELMQESIRMHRKIHNHANNCSEAEDCSHKVIAEIYSHLGSTYTNLGKFDKVVPFYKKSILMKRALYGDSSENVAITLYNLHHAYRTLNDHERAILVAKEALEIYKQRDPDNDLADVLNTYLTSRVQNHVTTLTTRQQ